MRLQVRANDRDRCDGVRERLERMLGFLTDDEWTLNLPVARPHLRKVKVRSRRSLRQRRATSCAVPRLRGAARWVDASRPAPG